MGNMASMFRKVSKFFKDIEGGIDRINRWKSICEWPSVAALFISSFVSCLTNFPWYAYVLGTVIIILVIRTCIGVYKRFNKRNLPQQMALIVDKKKDIIHHTCSNSIKLEQVNKLLGDLDNIFSEKFIRDMYRDDNNIYENYCIKLEEAIAISNGLFDKAHRLNILLWQFQSELKDIENNDLLSTLTNGVDIIMNLQKKYSGTFRNIKTNILEEHFNKEQKFIPLIEGILELEKLDKDTEVPDLLRNMANSFGLQYDKYIAEYYISTYLKKHLVGNKIRFSAPSMEKTKILNEELPHPIGKLGGSSSTYSGNKWSETYDRLYSSSGEVLYIDVSIPREVFEKILEKRKSALLEVV